MEILIPINKQSLYTTYLHNTLIKYVLFLYCKMSNLFITMKGLNMKFRGLKTRKNSHCNIGLLLLALIITFIIISPTHAATYNFYFSKNGSGPTSLEKTPCANVSDTQTKINGAGSSDTLNLYFNRGDTWSFKTAAATKTLCFGIFVGSNGPTVNVDAYGNGNKPVFDGLVSNFSFSTLAQYCN